MKKRVLAAMLWTYAIWYACNVLGSFAGIALPGAVIGLAIGALAFALPILRAERAAGTTPMGNQAPIPTES
jgi:putative effector of murein hydrolase LrgA (UPF0299 family)